MKKRILSLVLIIMLIVSSIPFTALPVSAATSGTCGDNLTWTFDDEGTLVISGNGEINQNWHVNWGDPIYRAKTVIIESGVTEIGAGAFIEFECIENISIPESIVRIGTNAFPATASLEGVYITDLAAWCNIDFEYWTSSPFSMGGYPDAGFYLNGELVTDIVIPDGVKSIGDFAFFGCRTITSITIPSSLQSVGINAFYDCLEIDSVYITDIASWCAIDFGPYANPMHNGADLYLNGELVIEVAIPQGVARIGEYTFEGCKSITNVTVPKSVMFIDDCAFINCSSLTNIDILGKNVDIGSSAFANCDSLEDFMFPEGTTSISNYIFESCSSLKTVTIPDTVTGIGSWAFMGCWSLEKVYYYGTKEEWKLINIEYGNDSLLDASVTFDYLNVRFGFEDYQGGAILTENRAEETEIILPSNVNRKPVNAIGKNAFAGNENITSITIPESVTYIEEGAFDGCSSLEEIIYEGEMLPCPITDPEELFEKAEMGFSGNGRFTEDFSESSDTLSVIEFIPEKNGSHYIFTEGTSFDIVWIVDSEGNVIADGYYGFNAGGTNVILKSEIAKGEKYFAVVRNISMSNTETSTDFVINYTSDVCGDVDGDDEISTRDVLLLRKYLAGLYDFESVSYIAADVDGDKELSTQDVLLLRKYLAGFIDELTFSGN